MITVEEYFNYQNTRINDCKNGDSNSLANDEVVKFNHELIEKYPWLLPRDYQDNPLENYNYTWTKLDNLMPGWYKAFGLQLCEEIQQALEKEDLVNDYRILDIKEKYGTLRWYDAYTTEAVQNIIKKYEQLSERICAYCGGIATHMRKDWILFLCEPCAKRLHNEYDSGVEFEKIFKKV